MKTDTFVVHWRAAEESGAYFLVVSFRRERGVVNATKRLFNVFRIVGGCLQDVEYLMHSTIVLSLETAFG